jgi:hypothetical protein
VIGIEANFIRPPFVSLLRVAVMLLLLSQRGAAQARVVSAPREPSLLNLTAGWAHASSLGDLRDLRVSADHLELRVWRGYGASETQATILRRTDGHWSASFARVIRCELQVPSAVADTASSATMRRFVAEARQHCGQSTIDVAPGARLLATDTLVVQPLLVPELDIEAAWKEAESAGALQLPPRAERATRSTSDVTLLIEARRGDSYRAMEIEEVDPPEVKADSQVKRIFAAVQRVRP